MGAALKAAGVVSGGDLTTEACATKLAYLFGRLNDSNKVKEILEVNLRGELSPRDRFDKSIYQDRPLVSKL